MTLLNKRQFKERLKKRYEKLLKQLRPVARKSGYALCVHGSMKKDLDIVAVPWSKKCVLPETLVKRLCKAIGKAFYANWRERLHGSGCVILLEENKYRRVDGQLGYIDINMTPKLWDR